MAKDPIVPTMLPTKESLQGEYVELGCLDIRTRQGVVHCHDAPGFLSLLVERPNVPTTVGLMTYVPAEPGADHGHGLISQFSPDAARSFAASLLRLADQADGGAGKQ